MSKILAIFLMVLSAFLASLSQMLLKKSSLRSYKSKIEEFINPFVICGYMILFLTMIINIVAYQYLPYKIGPVVNTLSYIFVFILSRLIFNEKINKNKLIGIIFIVIGILVFGL